METKNKERCTCGQSAPVYYPDENQWEPGCWECYYQSTEGITFRPDDIEAEYDSELDALDPSEHHQLNPVLQAELLLIEAKEQELRDAEERYQSELADMWINIDKDAYPNG